MKPETKITSIPWTMRENDVCSLNHIKGHRLQLCVKTNINYEHGTARNLKLMASFQPHPNFRLEFEMNTTAGSNTFSHFHWNPTSNLTKQRLIT